MAGPERFELPTAGFEDQNSSTELRADTVFNGPAYRNRTHIHGVEDRCIIHYTKAGCCIIYFLPK